MREGLIKLCLNVFMKYAQNHKKYFILIARLIAYPVKKSVGSHKKLFSIANPEKNYWTSYTGIKFHQTVIT